jgi:hypothetical protein
MVTFGTDNQGVYMACKLKQLGCSQEHEFFIHPCSGLPVINLGDFAMCKTAWLSRLLSFNPSVLHQPVPIHAQHPLLDIPGITEYVPPSSAPMSKLAPSATAMCFPRRPRYCAYAPRPHVREEN